MIFIGIDPDLHTTAIGALVEDRWYVDVLRVDKALKEHDAMVQMCRVVGSSVPDLVTDHAAVEGQEFILQGQARFKDIGLIGCVTGAVLASVRADTVLCPKPSQWKGNVPKHIHHARIGRDLGFAVEIAGGQKGYGVPQDRELRARLPLTSDWKHAMDALGLALWCREQHRRKAA